MNDITLEARVIGVILLCLLLFFGYQRIHSMLTELHELRDFKTSADAMHKSTGEIQGAVGTALGDRADTETAVHAQRNAADQSFEEKRHAQPAIGNWADQPIPDELRHSDAQGRRVGDGPAGAPGRRH